MMDNKNQDVTNVKCLWKVLFLMKITDLSVASMIGFDHIKFNTAVLCFDIEHCPFCRTLHKLAMTINRSILLKISREIQLECSYLVTGVD